MNYSIENASINSTFDTHFTLQQKGNMHDISDFICTLNAHEHVPDDKVKEIGNYSKISRIYKSENDNQPDIMKSNVSRHLDFFTPTLEMQHNFQTSTCIVFKQSEEYIATSNFSNTDTSFDYGTLQQQGNLHGVSHSSCIRRAPQPVPDGKEIEIGNYSTTSRTSKSENGDTESDIIKSDFRDFIELISSTLHEENDVESSIVFSNSNEQYRFASNVSNRDANFDDCICVPESFETGEKGIFSYHTNIYTSTGNTGNCMISLEPKDDNLQGFLRNDVEPHNRVLLDTQISKHRRNELSQRGEFHFPTNNRYVFAGPSNKISIVKGHQDDRGYICKECGNGFRYKSNLVSHYRTHTGEKPFSCDKCEKRFSRSCNLVAHQRIHTGEKPFACEKCEKRFRHPNSLAIYRHIHTGEKPFACDKCEKRFRHSSNLVVHRRIHTGKKPFACEKCEKRFSQLSSFAKHRRTHNGEKVFFL